MWNEFVIGLGNLIYSSFAILEAGNNYVNWFFIAAIFVVLVGWVTKQIQYNKEAKRTGGFQ